jgi:hypothetical protein
MEQASLIIGNGNWAVKSGSLLGYTMFNEQFYPQYVTTFRATTATRVDENGLIVTSSIGIARIDYSTGEAALLVEPQRTNLLTYSEDFGNASWLKLRLNVSGTPPWVNIGVSPDGTLTSKKIIANTQNNLHSVYVGSTSTVTATTYTLSCFAKQSGVQYLIMYTNLDSSRRVNFDLANGVTSYIGANILSTNIEDYGNGWYRCSLTFTSTVNNFRLDIGLGTNTDFAFVGNDIDGVEIWGAQLEAGSYATSYIPTTTASVTRGADIVTNSLLSSLQSNNIIANKGTFLWQTNLSGANEARTIFNLGNVFAVISLADGRTAFRNLVTGTYFGLTNRGNGLFKFSVAFNETSATYAINGVIVATQSIATQSPDFISIYHPSFGIGVIQRLELCLITTEKISDAELVELTTL